MSKHAIAEIAEIEKILKKQKNNTDLENELEYMKDVKNIMMKFWFI